MGRARVVDTRKDAEDIFRTFHARNSAREVTVNWTWPSAMIEAGVGQAEMYSSNKWKLDLKEYEDYKHIAESPRLAYIRKGWLRVGDRPAQLEGEEVGFEPPMPKHFAVLGKLLGIQVHLFRRGEDGALYLPKDEELYEVRVRHGMLGGARHPDTAEPFLFVYTKSDGIGMIITGDKLRIEQDGIAG